MAANAALSRAPKARRIEGFVMLAAPPQLKGAMVIDAAEFRCRTLAVG